MSDTPTSSSHAEKVMETARAVIELFNYWKESPFNRYPSEHELADEISKHMPPSVPLCEIQKFRNKLCDKYFSTVDGAIPVDVFIGELDYLTATYTPESKL